MKQINYKEYFEQKVQALTDYVKKYNLEALILGISGGIDSTVCAAICHEVSKRIPVKVIGRSLPTINNKEDEITTADLVGNAFCYDYKEIDIQQLYNTVRIGVNSAEISNKSYYPLANGNIQARLRMIYLYNLASIHKGIVIDTDNLTEHNLGYFTIHGDQGDVNPIGDLWKTQVFELAKWLIDYYKDPHVRGYNEQATAIIKSLNLKPTAGLGITNNDLEEIGAESYEQVDSVLQEILAWKRLATERGDLPEDLYEQREMFLDEQQMLDIPIEIIIKVVDRHFASEFKRKQMPIRI
jgi:NAD+ synthetase